MKDMEEEETNTTKVHLYHKEEANARVRADTKDRDGLHQKLDTCLHPLNPNTHPGESIVKITSGKIAPPTASVDSAVKIGEAIDRDVDVKDVLAYELAPVPTAMFTEDGMRICKAKSTLK
ncbi:hypothetical protein NQZ68_037142, partial [Dissostichus eleginoides]